MQTDLRFELEQLGFTERQARVYIALLRLGRCAAPAIVAATDLPRATCHDTLKQLVDQGLVAMLQEGDQQFFIAQPPERINALLALQQEELRVRQARAEKFLPRLLALAADGEVSPRVRIIHDLLELQDLHAEYANLDQPILQLLDYDMFLEWQRQAVLRERTKRLQTKRSAGRSILVTDKVVDAPAGSNFEIRLIPRAMLEAGGELTVCGDHVLMFSYQPNLFAIEIVSASMANTCRASLELAWQRAGEIEQKLRAF